MEELRLDRYVPLLRLLLDSFSAVCCTLMAVLFLRGRARLRSPWGGALCTWTAAVCAFHFLYRSTRSLPSARLGGVPETLDLLALFLLPALLFHLLNPERRAFGRVCLAAFYGAAVAGAALSVAHFGQPDWTVALRTASLALLGLSALAACLRLRQRGLLVMCGLLAAVIAVRMWTEPPWLLVVQDTLPLGFIFLITYSIERFVFFDVLIKKGALAFSALFVLTLYFVFIGSRLPRRDAGLLFPLTVWPIVLAYPWFNRRMCEWLDRACLRRRFSPAAAAKHFLAGLQGPLSEAELAERAERLLDEIFDSDATVRLAPGDAPPDPDCIQQPVLLHSRPAGSITLRARGRLLSEDLHLLASLADNFAFLLENLQLRNRRLEQEQRVRQLELDANRLELKALRAQINPHFLFNALNTIAGMIPRQPGRAEQTIEQLAEVFRYTLRRMDREWVQLEEEFDAVRAYLDVEQARFGDRLQFQIEMSPAAAQARIPAMIVQTLVENAVKHGIGRQSTPGRIEVEARSAAARVTIEVRDSGPGFAPSASSGAGYGLPNIRARLQGYFGDQAALRTCRDVTHGLTVACVEMPLHEGAAR
jgi:two-component sensor histidine kinase